MKKATLILALLSASSMSARFAIVADTRVYVPKTEPVYVKLAAQDLASDVRKITGRELPVVVEQSRCGSHCVVVASATQSPEAIPQSILGTIRSKWEAHSVSETPGGLLIAGSDEHGAMFGAYDFIERYLNVDPLYYWTGREPHHRESLSWDRVQIEPAEPTFRFRGWFLNDEDLLTEWHDGGGPRNINYPYYHQVTAPEVLARVFEAALRLQMNLVIPASFTDIDNPPERRMIEAATARGLYVTMHHVEPMGVSAFAFGNYWKSQGRDVPFSFFTQRPAFEQAWRHYAEEWAKFPGVIWQLGLRGIADRPVWVSDPNAPSTDEGRGKLISDAMAAQWRIVRAVDSRPHPLATTTLWMEGSDLNKKGLLQFPTDVTVIFADNSPGWRMQQDFFETPREPGRHYGIYYHHALWGSGPHLAQGVSPKKTYEIFREAVTRGSHWYAVLNVSNVREFALGLDASSRMLRAFPTFEPDRYLHDWCAARFGPGAAAAERAYRKFFDSYFVDEKKGTPQFLDGLALHAGTKVLTDLLAGKTDENATELLSRIRKQRAGLNEAGSIASEACAHMDAEGRHFFESNLISQQRILLGITKWLEAGLVASQASERGAKLSALKEAQQALAIIRSGQALAARGEFRDWYRGDRKMNLAAAEQLTNRAVEHFSGKQQ
jgi:hypothetical protein